MHEDKHIDLLFCTKISNEYIDIDKHEYLQNTNIFNIHDISNISCKYRHLQAFLFLTDYQGMGKTTTTHNRQSNIGHIP